MKTFRPVLCAAALALLASCNKPPASSYDSAGAQGGGNTVGLALGQNTAGESCTSQTTADGANVYCGSWDQPSAHVVRGGAASGASLATLATSSTWRASLESDYVCGTPAAGTILDQVPAEILSCTQRFGGWPHVAVVTAINGSIYYADGVLPALPPMQRAHRRCQRQPSAPPAPAAPRWRPPTRCWRSGWRRRPSAPAISAITTS